MQAPSSAVDAQHKVDGMLCLEIFYLTLFCFDNFFNPTGLLLIYLGFQFCGFLSFVYVFVYIHATLAFIFLPLLFCYVLLQFVYYLLFVFVCFFPKEREKEIMQLYG